MTSARFTPTHGPRRLPVRVTCIGAAALVLLAWPIWCTAADLVEFLSGAKMEGKVTKIDKENQQIHFEAEIAGRKIDRVYRYSQIHAITYQDKRYVLNEKSEAPAKVSDGAEDASSTDVDSGNGPRSREALNALIQRSGETPPDWFATAPLDFPKSMDLTWPQPPPQGWNNQKNVGQYIWDVINPNPGRWQHGVKFMHHLLEVNQKDRETSVRVMNELGRMYHDLLEDYPRAAYWWQRAGVHRSDEFGRSGPHLAKCYWRLGNRQMAFELLERLSKSNKGNVLIGCAKVWCDMGQPDKAEAIVRLVVRGYAQSGYSAGEAYLVMGDGHRTIGNYREAVRYYQLVLAESEQLKGRVKQNRERAQANLDAIEMFEKSDVSRVADGTYRGQSLGYEGPIDVEVEVRGYQITNVRVTQHKEKQFYSAMTDTPANIIKKNGVKGVDTTASATITSEAIVNAAAKALASGTQ